jgi:hypothetical protein
MARRSPAQARADIPRRRPPHTRIAVVPGIPARGQAEIARLERTRWHPGAVADALRYWERYVRGLPRPERVVARCGEEACCPDPIRDRELLESAVHALPKPTATILRKRLAAIDDLIDEWHLTWT